MRQGDYKYVFSEQRPPGTMQVWAEPFTTLRLQKIFNLSRTRSSGRTSRPTPSGMATQPRRIMYGVMDEVFQFATTFKEYPPRSFPPSFNPANIMEAKLDDYQRRGTLKRGSTPTDSRRAEQDDR